MGMLPELNQSGFLPEGIHPAAEVEVLERFAASSARRRWLGERLRDLLHAARATGHLQRVFLWGSYVTAKEAPKDLDVLLVLDAAFELAQTPDECKSLFDHAQARVRFNADIFWTKASIGPATLGLWLDIYQTGRDFTRRGIVEVVLT